MKFRLILLSALVPVLFVFSRCTTSPQHAVERIRWDPFLDTLQVRTLTYFLDTTDRVTGMAPDRWPSSSPCSIAAVGFALTSFPIAIERQLISRAEGAERALNTVKFFLQLPQNQEAENSAGYRGFFYHFIKMTDGLREWKCELSTVDTALLMAGVLCCQSYFDQDSPTESLYRALADSLYRRVEWDWAMGPHPGIAMAWHPESGFSDNYWYGYNEAIILYILAFGSPTHPAPTDAWKAWTERYIWAEYYDQEFISFGPLFGHQYSHCWIDFRGIVDDYTAAQGIDYFENSRRATYSQQSYAVDNPRQFQDYGEFIWGFTACDGPANITTTIDEKTRQFCTYCARGVSFDWVEDDGTIAPTAVGGSLPFAPEICIPALKTMRHQYGDRLWTRYGFVDAFNPTFVDPQTGERGWFDHDYLGIDQGAIALMCANLDNAHVWKIMSANPYIVRGLKQAGFRGGWLDDAD